VDVEVIEESSCCRGRVLGIPRQHGWPLELAVSKCDDTCLTTTVMHVAVMTVVVKPVLSQKLGSAVLAGPSICRGSGAQE